MKNKKMKKIISLWVIVLSLSYIGATESHFDAFFDMNRFFEDETKTNFEICYKIPNSSLKFIKDESSFLATIQVEYQFLQDNKIISSDSYIQKIGATNKTQTLQDNNYYIHKLSFGLGLPDITFKVIIVDKNTQKKVEFSENLELLDKQENISDLEFSQRVEVEERDIYPTLRRDGKVFYVTPKHIYEKPFNDTLFIYYEGKQVGKPTEDNLFEEVTRISKDDKIVAVFHDTLNVNAQIFNNLVKYPIQDLEDGLYNINIKLSDLSNNLTSFSEDYFIVKSKKYLYKRIFPNLENEYKLTKYFDSVKGWSDLSYDGKRNFLDRFWAMRDNVIDSEGNTLVDVVQERVHYANINFSTHKDGWKSDMGRIYIRNGKPFEIEKYVTDTSTKYTRKDYQIWKYRQKINRTYVFIDFQGNGDFRLVHDINDDQEVSDSQWQDYLGEEFDESILEN